jgi:4a-hydroxytetrahydrobiopterin dehydratase
MTFELQAMAAARSTTRLTAHDIATPVRSLGAPWQIVDTRLVYNAAPLSMRNSAALVSKAADIAEELNHHPDMAIGYHRLSIAITTHDSGGLTALDFAFAAQLELWRRAQPQ